MTYRCPRCGARVASKEELASHRRTENPDHVCRHCGSRFENRDEVMKHQAAAHPGFTSRWSCSALTSYGQAFGWDSTVGPEEVDLCLFCGQGFSRSSLPGDLPSVSESNWEKRIRHLEDVHHFRECNATRRFSRQAEFRLHIKHTHSGVLGYWTDALETACKAGVAFDSEVVEVVWPMCEQVG
ncbi:hypothetical protein B0T14DRAFT_234752 [Immersiella caudata]|uniref:C2H2-type domain-containing protein n=1 Tax=Immersiella caudata TaxID=314043 RepID=A0AA39WS73_9PEZI|nr:hypothetical protein B0T14DRAFT_234752 [Immersiella caudata]